MEQIVRLKSGDKTVLYYREAELWNEHYFITMRERHGGKFISDESIMELWKGTLEDMSWVEPNVNQSYALEVYGKEDGYFVSIAPVIICDFPVKIGEGRLGQLFRRIESVLSQQLKDPEKYEEMFKEELKTLGFTDIIVGGGCKIQMEE
jgi:hypothetical protein